MPSVDHAITSRPNRFSGDELIPFGKYMLLNKIQSGATAAVYRAKIKGEAGFERLVAIKRILPQMSGDPEFVRTFIEEAKTCARLNHENICPIYELGKVGESLYMCMEWLPSKDLGAITRRLSRQGEVMPPLVAAWIAGRLCDALDYAHSLKIADGSIGIIHRDLSPTNIVVSYEGQVKLIDFGLAKASGRAQQTNVDALKLKLGYMSPELVLGRAPDARSDVFGVGVCLYEMITARRLFAGKDDVTTLRMISNASVPPPSALVEDAPEELELITMRALERAPEDRWQTAGDMGKELANFIRDTDPMFGPRQVAEFMRALFTQDMEAEQLRVNELLKASHDPTVLEERRHFFASPAGAAAIAKAEAARRLSTLPPPARPGRAAPSDDPQSGRIPKAPRLPRIGGGIAGSQSASVGNGAGTPRGTFEDEPTNFRDGSAAAAGSFEEERTTHFDPTEEEKTTFLNEEKTTLLAEGSSPDAMTIVAEEKTVALASGLEEEDATHIFFNLEEGIGVPDLVSSDIDDGDALPTVLTDSAVLPDDSASRPALRQPPPPAPPRPAAPPTVRTVAQRHRPPTASPNTPPEEAASWTRLQTAPGARRQPETLQLRQVRRSDQLSTALLVIGVIMLILAVAGLVTKTPVGVKLGLRKPSVASIEVRTTPAVGAAVTLDGIYRGRAPLRLEGVHAGQRTIAVEAEGYRGAARQLSLVGGQRAQLLIPLEPVAR